MMYEDALSFSVLGIQVYAYGLLIMIGYWLFTYLFLWLSRKESKSRRAAAWTCLFSLLFGFVLARLVFVFGNLVLGDPSYEPFKSTKYLTDTTTGGFAMSGVLLGAVLACVLGSKLSKTSSAPQLDRLAPAIMTFLVPARLAEGFTSLGISRPLTTLTISNSFLAVKNEYDAYLRTYLLEAFVALLLLIVLLCVLKKKHRSGRVFALACLLYGITQTLMESLRYDGHLRHSFIGIQQVLSAMLFCGVLLWLAIRLLKQKAGSAFLPVLSVAMVPVVIASIIVIEFMIDRSHIGKLVSYALYILVLAVPTAMGILLFKQEETYGHK